MECRKALADSEGDFDKAVQLIHERGIAKVEKRAGREAGAGFVMSYIHNERIGVLLDIRAETDFVVRSDVFRNLAHELTMQIAAAAPETVDALLKQVYIRDETKSVEDIVKEAIAKVGENIKVNRFCRIEI